MTLFKMRGISICLRRMNSYYKLEGKPKFSHCQLQCEDTAQDVASVRTFRDEMKHKI